MSDKHTPGPWVVTDTIRREGVCKVSGPNGRGLVAIVGNGFNIGSYAADSRLIAAAPDLLASLIELLEPLERASAEMVSHGLVADENAEAAFDRARAAIAKTEGRS
jgi:hypothetical protein